MADTCRLNNRPNPPSLIFRSYGPKSTHNTQLTEGVIPQNIGVNLSYIRYTQTGVQSQGHYGGESERGGGGGSVLARLANGLVCEFKLTGSH